MGESAKQVVETGVDESGLGRWAWFKFAGSGPPPTRLIVAYCPCKAPEEKLLSPYMQQKPYFRLQGRMTCPRKLFVADLVTCVARWRTAGERIKLCLDANDDVQSGMLANPFRQRHVDISEVSRRVHPTLPPFSTFGSGGRPGSRQIDGVFLFHDLRLDALS